MQPTCTKTQKGMDCTMEIDTTNYSAGTYPLELQMCNGTQCDTKTTEFTVKEIPPTPTYIFYILGIILLGIFIYIIRKKGK